MSEAALHFDYSPAKHSIRQDLPEAYRKVWSKIASPGNWFPAEDRVSIAAEVRLATACELCLVQLSRMDSSSW